MFEMTDKGDDSAGNRHDRFSARDAAEHKTESSEPASQPHTSSLSDDVDPDVSSVGKLTINDPGTVESEEKPEKPTESTVGEETLPKPTAPVAAAASETPDSGKTVSEISKPASTVPIFGFGSANPDWSQPAPSPAVPVFGFGAVNPAFSSVRPPAFGFGSFSATPSVSTTSEKSESDPAKSDEKTAPVFGAAFAGGFGTALTLGASGFGESSTSQINGFEAKIDSSGSVVTLQDAANREYEAKKAKPLFEEVDVVTGEESERNVFEINVKLHVYDSETKQWKERGRAIARLNDAHDKTYSRLVIRMVGTLRIIINANIWKDMVVNRVSDKNVSFSAIDAADNSALKVFLISCSAENAEIIFRELKARRERVKALHPASPVPSSTKKVSPSPSLDSPTSESDQPVKKAKLTESAST